MQVESGARELLRDAAEGRLPVWAEAKPKRRMHMERVAGLMGDWAEGLGLGPEARTRWRAVGWLHDSLRDADPESLRAALGPAFRDLPAPFLHGPAAALRLESEGVDDVEVLDAIRYHTLGHAALERLGRALITADFIEPGRPELPEWRAALRARMPESLEEVFTTVVGARLRVGIERGKPIRPEFMEMWNALVNADGSTR
ncbi:MAG: HD domain-containing protein [Longimicrobiales bacterium]